MKVGILGAGQLARMMAQAGQKLGMEFMFLCPDKESCAAPFGQHLCADYDDEEAQDTLASWADVITYEFENVSMSCVKRLENQVPVYPSSQALSVARDRSEEKTRFKSLGVETAHFAAVSSQDDLNIAVADIGLPSILKTRNEGYDGKGQIVLRSMEDVSTAWDSIGQKPCILEAMVPFDREISIIACRGLNGEIASYTVSENIHSDGILRLSIASPDDPMQAQAETIITKLMNDLDYIGVLTVELFECAGKLLANEMAPRVHNSGHWTIEATPASQFENHLRAICNLPIGKTDLLHPAAMVNLIGQLADEKNIRDINGAFPHFYGKAPRPGRKVGHITLLSDKGYDQEFEDHIAALLKLAGMDQLAWKKRK